MAINTLQQRISKIHSGAAGAALTLVVALGLGAVTTHSAQGQTFKVLHKFSGSPDGSWPTDNPVSDAAGNLYGVTEFGGTGSCPIKGHKGCGTVFKRDTSGKLTVLHSFTGGTTDGSNPTGFLVWDKAGNAYGTTLDGGSSGLGVVFKVDTSGTESVLHSFTGGSSDGAMPSGGLIIDAKGNLYGVTGAGGLHEFGVVFKVDTSGTESVLHSFTENFPEGGHPYYTSLLMDSKGTLYGVTTFGGSAGSGTLYKLNKKGTLTTLHSFTGGGPDSSDGCIPEGNLVMDKNGNIYGTTFGTGPRCGGAGTVWKMSEKGTYTVLHNFVGGASDGANPGLGVAMDAKANLYGSTVGGGASGLGTVYGLNNKGTLTLLHSFDGADGGDGVKGIGGLILDTKGNLFGTIELGGRAGHGCRGLGCGTLWEITK